MSKPDNSVQEEVWYIYINEESKGPMGLRDIDVMLRTNEINSRTFCWKNGMKEWKPMIQIQQIKQSILDSSNELLQIQKKNIIDKNGVKEQNEKDNKQQPQQQEDQLIQNQDQNPLTILEVTVQNLLKKTFHQTQDGKWSIYDEEKGQWILQDQQPIQKITQMKNFLMNKLKSQFFANQKNKRKHKNNNTNQQPQVPLTKQELERKERNKKKTKRAAQKKKQKWYQAKINTFIYISGLPFDITQQQLKQFASKAGVLRIDLSTGKQKVKIYKDQSNLPKGDAAVSYARQQSVDMALQLLNESEIRPGFKVKVQKAEFNQKDQQYKRRQSKKQTKIKKILAKKNEERQFGWDDEAEDKGQGFRIVIMKYVFTLEQANNEQQMNEIKADITVQLQKIGEIKRIRFFENHPDGIIQIKFEKDVDAEKCIQIMNGRYFDGRSIICQYWDGQTDFKLDANSIALQQERLNKFANQLENNENAQIQMSKNHEEHDIKQNEDEKSKEDSDQKQQQQANPVPKQ